jgi:circadian clock protein KaiB
MYDAQTRDGHAVQLVDAAATTRVLVVDDDAGFGLDPFLDRMGHFVAQVQKRRNAARRTGTSHGGTVNDDGRRQNSPKIELVLYTSQSSEKSRQAVRAVKRVLEQYKVSQVSFTICDLTHESSKADEDAVVFTPTLVKRGPGPRTWIVGNLDQPELLIDLLDVSGVERRRD